MPELRTLLAASLLLAAGCAQPPTAEISEAELRDHVRWLADDARAGRGTGTPESEEVANYLAYQMAAAGLQPAGENGGWFQDFEVPLPPEPGTCLLQGAGLDWKGAGTVAASSTGQVRGVVMTAGYGDRGPLTGQIALLRRYGPPEQADAMQEDSSALRRKLKAAEDAGAIGVILGTHPADLARGGEERVPFGAVPGQLGIPVVTLGAKEFGELEATVQYWAGPYEVEMAAQVVRRTARARNVLGYVPGSGSEIIVVGGHYDHLGMGGENSLAPGVHAIHNGADDNASGTAVVLELAEQAQQRAAGGARGQRGLLFACWAAEEMGLLGSQWWVNHPTLPLEQVVANLNLDMVGRLEGGRATVGAIHDAAAFGPALERAQARMREAGLTLELVPAAGELPGGGGSDHMSFEQKQIPAVFFFSGLHADYHKPTDDWEKLTFPAMRELALGAALFLEQLDAIPRAELAYVAPKAAAPADPGRARGSGAWFGSIPDYAAAPEGGGLQIAGTSPGSPAEKAGLQAGDVIKKLDAVVIGDIYDFMDALGGFKTGQTIQVEILRAGKILTLPLTFIPRPAAGA